MAEKPSFDKLLNCVTIFLFLFSFLLKWLMYICILSLTQIQCLEIIGHSATLSCPLILRYSESKSFIYSVHALSLLLIVWNMSVINRDKIWLNMWNRDKIWLNMRNISLIQFLLFLYSNSKWPLICEFIKIKNKKNWPHKSEWRE